MPAKVKYVEAVSATMWHLHNLGNTHLTMGTSEYQVHLKLLEGVNACLATMNARQTKAKRPRVR